MILFFPSRPVRFAYDGLKTQRLTVPMVKGSDGQLQQCGWEDALMAAGRKVRPLLLTLINPLLENTCTCIILYGYVCVSFPPPQLSEAVPSEVAAVAGSLMDVESLLAAKDLLNSLGSEQVYTQEAFPSVGPGTDLRSSYLMNTSIRGIEVREASLQNTSNRDCSRKTTTILRKSFIYV